MDIQKRIIGNLSVTYLSGKDWHKPARLTAPTDTDTDKYLRLVSEGGEYKLIWDDINSSGDRVQQSSKQAIDVANKGHLTLSDTKSKIGDGSIDLQIGKIIDTDTGDYSSTTGGYSNILTGHYSHIGGGSSNQVHSSYSNTVGGYYNAVATDADYSSIVGGSNNTIEVGSSYSSIGGGLDNKINTGVKYANIPGGIGLIADYDGSTTVGLYNKLFEPYEGYVIAGPITPDPTGYLFTVGNGTADHRSNAFSVDNLGNGVFAGYVDHAERGDVAEYYESKTHNIPVGTSVVLDSKYIRAATRSDPVEDIIGVVSDTAAMTMNSASQHWHDKYINKIKTVDKLEYEYTTNEVDIEEEIEEDGKWIIKTIKKTVKEPVYEQVPVYKDGEIVKYKSVHKSKIIGKSKQSISVLNPKFDSSREYVPREHRPEWHCIGLLGRCKVLKTSRRHPRWKLLEEGKKYDWYLIR